MSSSVPRDKGGAPSCEIEGQTATVGSPTTLAAGLRLPLAHAHWAGGGPESRANRSSRAAESTGYRYRFQLKSWNPPTTNPLLSGSGTAWDWPRGALLSPPYPHYASDSPAGPAARCEMGVVKSLFLTRRVRVASITTPIAPSNGVRWSDNSDIYNTKIHRAGRDHRISDPRQTPGGGHPGGAPVKALKVVGERLELSLREVYPVQDRKLRFRPAR